MKPVVQLLIGLIDMFFWSEWRARDSDDVTAMYDVTNNQIIDLNLCGYPPIPSRSHLSGP